MTEQQVPARDAWFTFLRTRAAKLGGMLPGVKQVIDMTCDVADHALKETETP